MSERFLILERRIEADLAIIERLFAALRPLYRAQLDRFLEFLRSLQ